MKENFGKLRFKWGQLWMLLIFVCSYLLYNREMERRDTLTKLSLNSNELISTSTPVEITDDYVIYSKHSLFSNSIKGIVLLFHGCGIVCFYCY